MEKQRTEYIPGHINEKGEFLGNNWDSTNDKPRAEDRAREHVRQGEMLFKNWGIEFNFKPAVVTRHVYHEDSEPELL